MLSHDPAQLHKTFTEGELGTTFMFLTLPYEIYFYLLFFFLTNNTSTMVQTSKGANVLFFSPFEES